MFHIYIYVLFREDVKLVFSFGCSKHSASLRLFAVGIQKFGALD